ncbi:MAG: hypothetical protein K6G40_06180, partial [Eubacterium sp.]|nr:hypothetical protein [Eubacterium sp.]
MEIFQVTSNIYYEITAIIFGALLYFMLLAKHDVTDKKSRIFKLLVFIMLISNIVDVVTVIAMHSTLNTPYLLIQFLNSMNYLSSGILGYIFTQYVDAYTTDKNGLIQKLNFFIAAGYTVLMFINIFTGVV